MNSTSGILYVVATPIGNLGDISERAIATLQSAELIFCEDTRVFSKLAHRFAITSPKKSFFEQNEQARVVEAVEALQSGRTVALVSDAGTPGISDPGYRLVHRCRELGIEVRTVPGPSAAIAALSISGLPSDSFFFDGFLPPKPGKKRNRIAELLALECTIVSYDSPHRITETLEILAKDAPGRRLFIGRELTKLHEESLFGTASEVLERLADRSSIKGEIVLVIGAPEKKRRSQESDS